MEFNKIIEDKNKPQMKPYQADIRCPIHNCIIGKYDIRAGVINTTYYCPKCKFEYTYTIKSKRVEKR